MASIRRPDSINTPIRASVTTVTMAASSRISVGGQQYVNASLITLNAGTTGVNALDTGALGINKLYYIHAVVSGGALALVASLSKTAPTGFTLFTWTGFCFFTNASSQIAFVDVVQVVEILALAGGQAINSALAVLKFDTVVQSTHNAYNTATGIFTVPFSGFYIVDVNIRTNSVGWTISNSVDLAIARNAVVTEYIASWFAINTTTTRALIAGTRKFYFTAGEQIAIQAQAGNTSGTVNPNDGVNFNWLTIAKVGSLVG